MARLKQLVVDCRHPASLARFWAAALDGFEVRAYDDAEIARLAALGHTPETDPVVIVDGPTLELCFQQVDDAPTPGKNPLHPELAATDRAAEVARLVDLGASVNEHFPSHTWMQDPEGNDFCVADATTHYPDRSMTKIAVPQAEHVRLHVNPAAVLVAYAQHRRRFAEEVSQLDGTALATPSRCSEWTVADVLRHGCDVDEWMDAIWCGRSLPFTSFDPVTTPDECVAARRAVPDAEVRDHYVASAEAMAKEAESSGPDRWGLPAVSPIGFVPWWLSTMHIFFDSWVHERDVLLPLGQHPPVKPEEATPVVAYCLAAAGMLIREPTDTVIAGIRVTVEQGIIDATPVAEGSEKEADIAGVIDALCGRGYIEAALAGSDGEVVERFAALGRFLQPDAS